MRDPMPDLTIRAATEADVRRFAEWRHPPPYDVYDIPGPVDKAVGYFLRPSTNCHVIVEDDEVAAFFTFGSDARVPGGDYSTPARDIGLGMRPELTGQGRGRSFIDAVVEFARVGDMPLRVTIAVANLRAIRVWSNAGFREVQRFASPELILGSNEFLVLEG